MTTLPEVQSAVTLPAARMETVIAQRRVIMKAIKEAMGEGIHYGKIPGVEKPGCFKPGAELLCLLFGLRPQFEERLVDLGDQHFEVVYTCSLYSPDGQLMGQGVGSCSTLESKYRYRNAALKCPECGKEAIIKGKAQYGGGWICFAKKGGCGAKWQDGDPIIEKQERGKIENPDIADQRNTVRKMAKKRAHVDAALTTTGASEFFTQDIEDFPEYQSVPTQAHPELKAKAEPKPQAGPGLFYALDGVDAKRRPDAEGLLKKAGAVYMPAADVWHAPGLVDKLKNRVITEAEANERAKAKSNTMARVKEMAAADEPLPPEDDIPFDWEVQS
jgi:hypothetical protein